MKAEDKIIVALDVNNPEEALDLVQKLESYVGYFKVGLEFINSMLALLVTASDLGNATKELIAIRELFSLLDKQMFWDGKLKDIPNTVGKCSIPIAKMGVEMFNIHASGGVEMMRNAVENRGNSRVLAVTVLTSLSEEEAYLSYGAPSKAKVIEFARWAKIAGVNGLICSAKELEVLGKCEEFDDLLKVTPGIRPKWAQKGDQKRVMTPAEAIAAGADYLVIGRPITQPPEKIGSPVDASKKIAEEIEQALKEKRGEK